MMLSRYSTPLLARLSAQGPLGRLQGNLDRFFTSSNGAGNNWLPALEIAEAEGEFIVTLELPGVHTSDVKVTLDDGVLTVSGERKYEGAKEIELRLSERAYGKFERSVRLSAAVQADKVQAVGKDGILTISLPKTEEAKPREIKVSAS